jgi:predicted transcriptional regulator
MKLTLFNLRGAKESGETMTPELGPLEREVMETVWHHYERDGSAASGLSVRDVHLAFGERLAYTTLMTTLDRLHKKGLLERHKDGRAFLYSPRMSPQEFERSLARSVIDTLLGRGREGVEPVLACIVDAVGAHDRALLDELDRLIEEKRRALRRRGK